MQGWPKCCNDWSQLQDSNRVWLRQSPACFGVPSRHASGSPLAGSNPQLFSSKKAPARGGLFTGANYRIRTCDLLITNQLLYQLS